MRNIKGFPKDFKRISKGFPKDFDPRPLPTPAGWPWPALREAGDRPSSRNPDSVEIL